MLVETGSEQGGIEEDEKEMIHGVIELADTKVHEVMVPRIGIRAVDVNDPMEEVLDLIVRAGHSRLPVYEENLDNIIGILYAKDLLPYLKGNGGTAPQIDIRKLARPPVYVPETKAVDELLHEMQVTKRHIAIVVDEYGGTAGLITHRGRGRGDRRRDPGRVRPRGVAGRAARRGRHARLPRRRAGQHGRPARPVRPLRHRGGRRGRVRHGRRVHRPPRRAHPAAGRGGPVPRRDPDGRDGRAAAGRQGDRHRARGSPSRRWRSLPQQTSTRR